MSGATLASPVPPTVGIIGTGRLGSALAQWFSSTGQAVSVVSREPARAATLAHGCGRLAHATDPAGLRGAHFVFLAVPDDRIGEVCKRASGHWRAGQIVLHSSGITGLDALRPARDAGAGVACAHPVLTIGPGGAALASAAWGVEGDSPATTSAVGSLLRGAGAERVFGLPTDRVRYHLACVMASNLVTVLLDEARRMARVSGLVDGDLDVPLARLAHAAAAAAAEGDAATALTGPAVRGDAETVRAHLGALRGDDALRDVYRLLTDRAVAMGERAARIAADQAAAVRRVIGGGV
ncbi:MAG: DUF2520 domain-containing protein [Planctomycetes bacterium]|nr:DUF2520 domain-containing protein [Planctomycetota bacterium]